VGFEPEPCVPPLALNEAIYFSVIIDYRVDWDKDSSAPSMLRKNYFAWLAERSATVLPTTQNNWAPRSSAKQLAHGVKY
jgi:hypothetical protein